MKTLVINKKMTSALVLATLLSVGSGGNAQAKGLSDALPYLAIPVGITIGKQVYDRYSANQQKEDAMLKAEEQRRIAYEQQRLDEEQQQRKQDEYDRWFASLPKEKQVAMVRQQEQAQQAQEAVAGKLIENVLPILGNLF